MLARQGLQAEMPKWTQHQDLRAGLPPRSKAACSILQAQAVNPKQPWQQAKQMSGMHCQLDPCQHMIQLLRDLRHEQQCRCWGMQLPASCRAPAQPKQGSRSVSPPVKRYANVQKLRQPGLVSVDICLAG